MNTITPAILTYSRVEFEETLELYARLPGVSRVQIDVVDEQYADQVSWPYVESDALRVMRDQQHFLPHLDRIEYEIDLMCEHVEEAIDDWAALGAARFTLHLDALLRSGKTFRGVQSRFCGLPSSPVERSDVVTFGAAVHLDSSPETIAEAAQADYVQCMGIAQVGTQGALFDARVVEQVRTIHRLYPNATIQVDGGVTIQHAKQLAAVGATTFVVGSAILQAPDPATAFAAFDASLEVDISKGAINRL